MSKLILTNNLSLSVMAVLITSIISVYTDETDGKIKNKVILWGFGVAFICHIISTVFEAAYSYGTETWISSIREFMNETALAVMLMLICWAVLLIPFSLHGVGAGDIKLYMLIAMAMTTFGAREHVTIWPETLYRLSEKGFPLYRPGANELMIYRLGGNGFVELIGYYLQQIAILFLVSLLIGIIRSVLRRLRNKEYKQIHMALPITISFVMWIAGII